MKFSDTLILAWRTVKSNRLRTGLTVCIIAFGIMALVGIVTAITAMNQKFTESFSSMGVTAFTIRYKARNFGFTGNATAEKKVEKKQQKKEKKSNLGKIITRQEAEQFVRQFNYPSIVGISISAGRGGLVSFGNKKTSPNVMIQGGDENYLNLNGNKLINGRNFTRTEVDNGGSVCILGYDVALKLFKQEGIDNAVGNTVRINNHPYRVIGVIEGQGSSFGFSRDNVVITTYNTVAKDFPSGNSYGIAVKVPDIHQVPVAMGEAEAAFRPIRKLTTLEQSNFTLVRSDSMADSAMNTIYYLQLAAMAIGMITLIGAAIGLMNIMLVAVSERTKEVGLVKALGGKSRSVRLQFLLEAVLISILGALLGIILGILVGNLFSIVLSTGFVVPWIWVMGGIVICTIVGLLAGLYPALKAGRLNPIQALRYE